MYPFCTREIVTCEQVFPMEISYLLQTEFCFHSRQSSVGNSTDSPFSYENIVDAAFSCGWVETNADLCGNCVRGSFELQADG